MTRLHTGDIMITVSAWRMNNDVVADWYLYRAMGSNAMKRPRAHRRVRIRITEDMSAQQLTEIVRRMAQHVISTSRGTAYVPRGASWQEISEGSWSVPPGGGEGGENRSDES